MADLKLDPSRTALLIGDFYADAMGSQPHATSRHCIENTLAVRAAARKAGILVCYTATVFRPGYVEVADRNKSFGARKRSGSPAPTDPVAMIHEALKPADNEVVIGKHRAGALYGNDLEMILRANNAETILLLGFATSGVVLSTTRYAADADFRIVIIEDCCADRDAATHDFLIQKIFPLQAEIVQSPAVVAALGAK